MINVIVSRTKEIAILKMKDENVYYLKFSKLNKDSNSTVFTIKHPKRASYPTV